jgi:hypothetical protein
MEITMSRCIGPTTVNSPMPRPNILIRSTRTGLERGVMEAKLWALDLDSHDGFEDLAELIAAIELGHEDGVCYADTKGEEP